MSNLVSAGAKKDLLVMFFAKAIFETALTKETNGSIPRDRSNQYHHENKRIDRRISSFMEKMNKTIDQVINADLARWLHSKTHSRIFSILTRMSQTEAQLETLGLYVLYVNFCKRKQKLDDIFTEYQDPNLYFDDIDLIKKTNITDDHEALSMRMAYDVVAEIKA